MQDFDGKVAVITGAASGIGRGIANRCAAEGMRVVIADVDEAGLQEVARELQVRGASVRVVPTDVRDSDSVEELARQTLAAFEEVHLLFNNAGVMLGGVAWERTEDDWRWVMDVNLFGVVNGLRVFMPILLEQNQMAHIVNTASIGGLMTGPFLSPYIVSKHAVIALTESVYFELQTLDTEVGISVLCPGPIDTGITNSERVRPDDRSNTASLRSEAERRFDELLNQGVEAGLDPDEVGPLVFAGLRANRFWIYTHPMEEQMILPHAQSIIHGTNPVYDRTLSTDMLEKS